MTLTTLYLGIAVVAVIGCVLLAILLYRKNQKYQELKLDYFTQKFETFKQRAKETKSITEAVCLLQQYKSLFPVDFFLNNNLEKLVIVALVDKILSTSDCGRIFSLIGDLAHRPDSDSEVILWKKVKFEVLSHLEAVSKLNEHSLWLKRIIDSKT